MADEIIEELWAVKDSIAREAGYDVDKLVELVEGRQKQRRELDNTDLIQQKTNN